MANSIEAIQFVLSNEGGFVDNPNDSGGVTNFGLSLRFLRQISAEKLRKYGIFTAPDLLVAQDIHDLNVEQAKMVYKGEFWDAVPFEKIENQTVVNYVFDCAVLHGISEAIKILQRAVWAVKAEKSFIEDDGILGIKTIYAVNLLTKRFLPLIASLESSLMAERAGLMRLLCVKNPKNREFLDGWLKRCYRI